MSARKRHAIVIVGGSFGGLTAAHTLRRLLPPGERDITVVSKDERFVFVPSLPWVALGRKSVADISFALRPSLERKGIGFIAGAVDRVDPERQRVLVGDRAVDYDFLVIATGHGSANEAVQGLEPFDGPGHSLVTR